MPKKQSEEAALEEELSLSDGDTIPGLEDTIVQRVQALLQIWNFTDDRRVLLRKSAEIDRQVGNKDSAKQSLTELHEKVTPKLVVVLKNLVEELASEEAEEIRANVDNWLQIRLNLRPLLQKRLIAVGIDVSDTIDKAKRRETEDRQKASQD